MKSDSKTKIRPGSKQTITKNNNFSEKFMQYTRQRKFYTPSKQVKLKSQSKQILISKQDLIQKIQPSTLGLSNFPKSPKININMQIKNLNIFGQTNPDNKKKKLHKKTISALGKHQKDTKEKQFQKELPTKKLKHTKTKSQQTIKITPAQWGKILAEHSKKNQSQSINIISKYALCNRRGFAVDKKDKINQDTYILIENFIMKNRYLFGVCDGHGVNGHFVSDFVKEILPQNIEYTLLKHKSIKKFSKNVIESSLKQAFSKTAKDLQQSGIDINFSGTTTCLIYLYEHHLFCANLGDSRAVIFRRVGQRWDFKLLSSDHKAEDDRQAYRIKMNGGRVFPYQDEDGEQMGPYRVWIQQKNIPGLAMTRSFGDYVASTVGVISQPQVIYSELSKQDKFVVIATDGLWEFISNDEVLELVMPAFVRNNPEEAIQILQDRAVEAWKRQDQNIDDITIQVIFFRYY